VDANCLPINKTVILLIYEAIPPGAFVGEEGTCSSSTSSPRHSSSDWDSPLLLFALLLPANDDCSNTFFNFRGCTLPACVIPK
jgi:hypothetical protein